MKTLLMMSLTGGALALLVMLLRTLLGKKLHPRLIYLLWLPVLLSLLIPLRLESPISFRNAPAVRYVEQIVSTRMEAPIVSDDVLSTWTDEMPDDVSADTSVSMGTLPGGETVVEVQQTVRENPKEPLFDLRMDAWDILAIVWLLGAAVTGAYIVFVNFRFRARVRRSRKPLAVPWILTRQMGKTKVYVSKVVPSPCLIGLFAPFIVVTPQAIEEENRLVHVLTHERMHKAQLDPLWSLLRTAALILHWFNPIVWIAASLSRSDCENACDALTIRAIGEEQRVDYGKTLLSFLRAKPTATALINTATTMAQSRRQIRRRISLIAKKQRYAWLAAVLAVVLTLTGCALTMTAPEATKTPESPSVQPTESPAASPEPVETPEYVIKDETLRNFAANYEQALKPYVADFDIWEEFDILQQYPQLEGCELYGRINEEGDAYILATLPALQKADVYQDIYLGAWQETTADDELTYKIARIGVLGEPGDYTEVQLDAYELSDVLVADAVNGVKDTLIIVPEGSDHILCELHTVSSLRAELFIRNAYPGATFIMPESGAYLTVPMLNSATMQATGWSTALQCYLPVEEDLIRNLEFEPIDEKELKDFWEDVDCMSLISYHPDGKGENYIYLCSDRLIRYEDHSITGVCAQDVYYERFNGIISETFGIDPFFYIHCKAFNSPENVQVKMATLSFPNYETGEMLTQTLSRTDAQKLLDQLQMLVFEPDDILVGGTGCPFGGILTLRTSECEYTFHVATDSCGVLCYEGNIYLDYGDQKDLFEIFPECDPYTPTYTYTGENDPRPVTLEVLAADADEWDIYENEEQIQELYELTVAMMARGETAKSDEKFICELDFRDKNVARILHVEVCEGSFVVDGRAYPDKKRELLTLIESLER